MTENVSGPLPRRKLLLVLLVVGLVLVGGCVGALTFLVRSGLLRQINEARAASDVQACKANLWRLHQGIILYKVKTDELPDESGVRFLAQLWAEEVFERTSENAAQFTCPAVDVEALAIGELPWDEWWSDPDMMTGNHSAYAVRDQVHFPLTRLSSKEPLAACDNDPFMNHSDVTNVLYSDGSVKSFSIEELKREGILLEDEDVLLVGSDSPIEDLQKLSLD